MPPAIRRSQIAPGVLLTEAPDGSWGLAGHANTNEELIAAARAQIAELHAQKPDG
jgi:hypothetical protein